MYSVNTPSPWVLCSTRTRTQSHSTCRANILMAFFLNFFRILLFNLTTEKKMTTTKRNNLRWIHDPMMLIVYKSARCSTVRLLLLLFSFYFISFLFVCIIVHTAHMSSSFRLLFSHILLLWVVDSLFRSTHNFFLFPFNSLFFLLSFVLHIL